MADLTVIVWKNERIDEARPFVQIPRFLRCVQKPDVDSYCAEIDLGLKGRITLGNGKEKMRSAKDLGRSIFHSAYDKTNDILGALKLEVDGESRVDGNTGMITRVPLNTDELRDIVSGYNAGKRDCYV